MNKATNTPIQMNTAASATPSRRNAGSIAMLVRMTILCVLLGTLPLVHETTTARDNMPNYVPPAGTDLSPARIVGSTNRGASDESLSIAVIAPDHTGLTLQAQPSLFWHQSRSVRANVSVTIQDPSGIEPLLETKGDTSLNAGIVEFPIAGTGIELKPGVEYRWSVSIEGRQSGPAEVLSSGVIKRLAAGNNKGANDADVHALAAQGIWYDAIVALCNQLKSDNRQTAARAQLTSLLRQVGLTQAANFESKRPTRVQQARLTPKP